MKRSSRAFRLTAPLAVNAAGKPDICRAFDTAVPESLPPFLVRPMPDPRPPGYRHQPGFSLGMLPGGGTLNGVTCIPGGFWMKDPNDPDGEQFLEEFDQLYSGYRRKRVLGTELAIADVPYMEGRITSATEAYIHVMVTDAERDPPQDGILFPAAHLLILRRPSNTQAAWTPVDSVELTFTEGIVQGDATIIYYTTCILEDAGDYVFRITPNSNTTRLRFTAGVWWMGFFI